MYKLYNKILINWNISKLNTFALQKIPFENRVGENNWDFIYAYIYTYISDKRLAPTQLRNGQKTLMDTTQRKI